jgi:hypothetical protein
VQFRRTSNREAERHHAGRYLVDAVECLIHLRRSAGQLHDLRAADVIGRNEAFCGPFPIPVFHLK